MLSLTEIESPQGAHFFFGRGNEIDIDSGRMHLKLLGEFEQNGQRGFVIEGVARDDLGREAEGLFAMFADDNPRTRTNAQGGQGCRGLTGFNPGIFPAHRDLILLRLLGRFVGNMA